MAIKTPYRNCLMLLVLTVGGMLGGFVNGLLGTGGGIILTFTYSILVGGKGDGRDRFVTAMATVLPISALSLFTYSSEYLRNGSYLIGIIIPSAFGGLAGAYLSTRLRPILLERIFAVLVIYAGIKMVV